MSSQFLVNSSTSQQSWGKRDKEDGYRSSRALTPDNESPSSKTRKWLASMTTRQSFIMWVHRFFVRILSKAVLLLTSRSSRFSQWRSALPYYDAHSVAQLTCNLALTVTYLLLFSPDRLSPPFDVHSRSFFFFPFFCFFFFKLHGGWRQAVFWPTPGLRRSGSQVLLQADKWIETMR